MNPFSTASLSPILQTALPCALPYGLTWEELQPVLPGFDLQQSRQAQAIASHTKQGLNGGDNSAIFTIHYPTAENGRQSLTLFIKHIDDPDRAEAQKYQFLAAQGVPLPRLLAAFQHDKAEILLLEFLPVIGIDFNSPAEVEGLLDLSARINAVQNPPDFFRPAAGMPQAEFDELVRAALLELEHDPARAAGMPSNAARVLDAYQAARRAAQSMPRALNHREFSYQQVGQDSSRRLVVFDLDTMAPAPRFSDIAGILYSLSIYTGRGQIDLFKTYLERLSSLAPVNLSLEDALHELRWLRILEACESLPWLVEETRNPGAADMHEALAMTLNALWDDLTTLGLA